MGFLSAAFLAAGLDLSGEWSLHASSCSRDVSTSLSRSECILELKFKESGECRSARVLYPLIDRGTFISQSFECFLSGSGELQLFDSTDGEVIYEGQISGFGWGLFSPQLKVRAPHKVHRFNRH